MLSGIHHPRRRGSQNHGRSIPGKAGFIRNSQFSKAATGRITAKFGRNPLVLRQGHELKFAEIPIFEHNTD